MNFSTSITIEPNTLVLAVNVGSLWRINNINSNASAFAYEPLGFISNNMSEVEVIALKCLETIKPLAIATSSIEVTFLKNNEFTLIAFPKNLSTNLHKFLQMGRLKPEFGCVDFINYLFGKCDCNKFNAFDISEWEIAGV